MREVQRCSSKMESVSKKRRVGVVGTGALKAADYELVPHHRSMIPLVLLASASEAFTIGRTPHAARATTRSSFITSKVVDVRSHEEFEAAINADNLVVVEFGMSWCAPCKKSAPELQRLSEEFPDISVYQVHLHPIGFLCEPKIPGLGTS